jgi:hypothetical protein
MVKKREHKVDFDKRKNVPEELATKKEDIFEEYDRAIQVSQLSQILPKLSYPNLTKLNLP